MDSKKPETVAVGSDGLLAAFDGNASELVFWSFRYFLGRMTIATCDFAERLAKAWPHLAPNIQSLIRREIDEAFKRDDELRAEANETGKPPQWLPLGWDCDRAAWQKVRDAYSANVAVRDAEDRP